MEIPIGILNFEKVDIATIRAIQITLAEKTPNLDKLIGNQTLRQWLDGFCSYLIFNINNEMSK